MAERINWRQANGYQKGVAVKAEMLTPDGYTLVKYCRLTTDSRISGIPETRAIVFDRDYVLTQVRRLLADLAPEDAVTLTCEALGVDMVNSSEPADIQPIIDKWSEIVKGKDPKSARWEKVIHLLKELTNAT